MFYTPPAVITYLLYDWAKKAYYKANRKNPAEFANDVWKEKICEFIENFLGYKIKLPLFLWIFSQNLKNSNSLDKIGIFYNKRKIRYLCSLAPPFSHYNPNIYLVWIDQ